MFCYQCEQTKQGQGCQVLGVCGKDETASLQDLLIHALKGISQYAHRAAQLGARNPEIDVFTIEAIFATLTNVNFDADLAGCAGLQSRSRPQQRPGPSIKRPRPRPASPRKPSPDRLSSNLRKSADSLLEQGRQQLIDISFANNGKELKNLEELVIYGLKGVAAYAYHAMMLGSSAPASYATIHELLNALD